MNVELTDAEAAVLLKAGRYIGNPRRGARPVVNRRVLESAMHKLWQARWDHDIEGKLSGTKHFGRQSP